MKTVTLDRDALILLVQEMESGMIVGPVLAKNLREQITLAAASEGHWRSIADGLVTVLRTCTCNEAGSWPTFKAEACVSEKSKHKLTTCVRCEKFLIYTTAVNKEKANG